jgi:hypothetical protein
MESEPWEDSNPVIRYTKKAWCLLVTVLTWAFYLFGILYWAGEAEKAFKGKK